MQKKNEEQLFLFLVRRVVVGPRMDTEVGILETMKEIDGQHRMLQNPGQGQAKKTVQVIQDRKPKTSVLHPKYFPFPCCSGASFCTLTSRKGARTWHKLPFFPTRRQPMPSEERIIQDPTLKRHESHKISICSEFNGIFALTFVLSISFMTMFLRSAFLLSVLTATASCWEFGLTNPAVDGGFTCSIEGASGKLLESGYCQ